VRSLTRRSLNGALPERCAPWPGAPWPAPWPGAPWRCAPWPGGQGNGVGCWAGHPLSLKVSARRWWGQLPQQAARSDPGMVW